MHSLAWSGLWGSDAYLKLDYVLYSDVVTNLYFLTNLSFVSLLQVQVIPQEVVHQEVVPHQITQQQVIPTHLTQGQQVHVTHEGQIAFTMPNTYVQQQPPNYSQVTQQPTNSHITLTNVPQQHVYIDIPYNTQQQQQQQQPQQQQQQQQVATQVIQPQVVQQFHY